jgi:hypothetical protein
MNLQCPDDRDVGFKHGFKAARHAAAELALKHDELLSVTLAMRDYIDALPKDLVLPAMPGFDRDWADSVIDREKTDGADITVRKAFICTGCEGVYADEPVSKCDCMPKQNTFYEGTIHYKIE